MKRTIGILGGDARLGILSRLLVRDGYSVRTWQVPNGTGPDTLEIVTEAETIVLPVPLAKDGSLNGTGLALGTLWEHLRPEQRLYAGAVSAQAREAAEKRGLQLTDYFTREELAVRNAIPTAEGAIELAMKHLPVTLHGTACLVVGFGRIGKVLAHELHELGANVTVSARKLCDLAWIDAFGYAAAHTNRLSGTLRQYRVIFNTVPHPVFDEALLGELSPDCLIIELASTPGVEQSAVEKLHLNYIKAGGLPGKVAPETAAAAIKETLCKLMEEEV